LQIVAGSVTELLGLIEKDITESFPAIEKASLLDLYCNIIGSELALTKKSLVNLN